MTAVQISEDIHLRMAKKRIEILEKYNLRFDMKDLADAAIEEGFDKIEKRLGIVKVTWAKMSIINKINKQNIKRLKYGNSK